MGTNGLPKALGRQPALWVPAEHTIDVLKGIVCGPKSAEHGLLTHFQG